MLKLPVMLVGVFLSLPSMDLLETSLTPREMDPVVILGSSLPRLIGQDLVQTLVGFSWQSGSWVQIPLQVDERHVVDWFTIKGGECRLYNRNMTDIVYADENTLSGPDEDTSLDQDDEIVFMAKNVGDLEVDGSYPDGVLEGVRETVEVIDDAIGTTLGFVYLFVSDGSLDQSAGYDAVTYVFNLTTTNEAGSNHYLDVYNLGASLPDFTDYSVENKEDSYFSSKFYKRHFSENWNYDGLNIYAGDSTGEDMMAHQDFQFSVSSCTRSADSFSHGGTAFIVNKDGPVRAIRSFVGANSGTITQRESVFYEQREELRTFIKVHSIPGLMDYITYKEDLPMTFYNCHNQDGISIDGIHEGDDFNNDYCPWEFVTGRAGSLVRSTTLDHDLGAWMHLPNVSPAFFTRNWFYDNREPTRVENGVAIHPFGLREFYQCSSKLTEQKASWGTHGFRLKPGLPGMPNTDPNRNFLFDEETTPSDCQAVEPIEPWLYHFTMTNNYYYLPPGVDVATAETLHQEAITPLSVIIK